MTSKPNSRADEPTPSKIAQLYSFGGAGVLRSDKRASTSGLADRIGRGIISGEYAPGSLFPPEPVILETFGVSRTALREAYSKLTAKGLVHARPRVGTSILPRSEWNLLDQDVLKWHLQTMKASELVQELYQIRRMIEPSAAEMAAVTRTDEDMARIDAAFEAMQANSADQEPLVEADFRFHVAILTATHNGFIGAFSSLIRAAMLSSFELSWRGAEVIKDTRLEQHGDVANAIRKGKAALARHSMEELLDHSFNDVRAGIDGLVTNHAPNPAAGRGTT